MKSSGLSRNQPWRTCFGPEWSTSNGFLRTMVTTINKLNTGRFTFLGFLSKSEILHLGGTPDNFVTSSSSLRWSQVHVIPLRDNGAAEVPSIGSMWGARMLFGFSDQSHRAGDIRLQRHELNQLTAPKPLATILSRDRGRIIRCSSWSDRYSFLDSDQNCN
jgi:hypothetical protein